MKVNRTFRPTSQHLSVMLTGTFWFSTMLVMSSTRSLLLSWCQAVLNKFGSMLFTAIAILPFSSFYLFEPIRFPPHPVSLSCSSSSMHTGQGFLLRTKGLFLVEYLGVLVSQLLFVYPIVSGFTTWYLTLALPLLYCRPGAPQLNVLLPHATLNSEKMPLLLGLISLILNHQNHLCCSIIHLKLLFVVTELLIGKVNSLIYLLPFSWED